MPNPYNIGDLVQLTANFSTVATEVLISPTSVTFTVRAPDGTEQTPTPINPSTGVYQTSVSITESGTWRWRVVGTGAAKSAADGVFEVVPHTF